MWAFCFLESRPERALRHSICCIHLISRHLSQCPANAWFRVCPWCAPITTDHVVWWYNRKRSQLIAEAFRLFIRISISFVTHAYYWTSIIRPWSLDITPQRFNECRVLFLSYVRIRILLKHVFTSFLKLVQRKPNLPIDTQVVAQPVLSPPPFPPSNTQTRAHLSPVCPWPTATTLNQDTCISCIEHSSLLNCIYFMKFIASHKKEIKPRWRLSYVNKEFRVTWYASPAKKLELSLGK